MATLPPLQTRDLYLSSMKELGDRYYDDAYGLITLPIHPNVHLEYLPAGTWHATRESLYYALVLLLIGGEKNVSRASRVIDRTVDAQEQSDPEHPFYGLWHYVAEESVLTWPVPDTNWADFNALTLLMIWHSAADQLSGALRDKIREAIRRASVCIHRKNTSPHYTNIALKGTFVIMGAAELLGDTALAHYGRDRMRRIAETFRDADSFAEYNSPTYAAVSLSALGAIQTFVGDEEVKSLALGIQHSFWRHVGLHFHVPTGEMAGPHSRAYHLMIRESPAKMGSLIERATHGRVKYALTDDLHDAFGPVFTCCLDFDVTPDIADFFLNADRTAEVREVARRFDQGGATETTTYICPAFCAGTVNFQDGWEQRHNLIAYWPEGADVGWLRHRYLHDSRPCCAGFFTSAQKNGCMLTGSFLGDFADDHPCFQTEGVTASYMGAVLEFGLVTSSALIQKGGQKITPGANVAFRENETVFVRLPGIWMACKFIRNRSGLAPEGTAWIKPEASALRIEFPHYEGEPRDIKWTDFSHAETVYGLVLEQAGEDWEEWTQKWDRAKAETAESAKSLQIQWAGLEVSVPNQIESQGDVRGFYKSGPPWDSLAPRRLLPTRA